VKFAFAQNSRLVRLLLENSPTIFRISAARALSCLMPYSADSPGGSSRWVLGRLRITAHTLNCKGYLIALPQSLQTPPAREENYRREGEPRHKGSRHEHEACLSLSRSKRIVSVGYERRECD